MMRIAVVCLVAATVLVTTAFVAADEPDPAPAYDLITQYDQQQIEGWQVRVNHRLSKADPDLCRQVLVELQHQLYLVTRLVPAEAVDKMRQVTIWVEVEQNGGGDMCYHPNRGWLISNDYNPKKAKAVEIGKASEFIKFTIPQPYVVLHELAHSYHDRELGFDHPRVSAAYEAAVESGKYDEVLHTSGRMTRHYALADQKEYFAECTEAFFGTNDFYPFVRSELKEHDPQMFEVLSEVWGVKKKQEKKREE